MLYKMKMSFILCLILLLTGITQQQQAIQNPSSNQPSPRLKQTQPFQQSLIMQIFGNNQCKIPQTPKKLAIATVTRFRATNQQNLKQGIQFFKQFLKQYAEMQCDIFDSIYFIWNNEKSPQQYPNLLQRRQHWKKNVYFIQTKFNSMDHRFAFPSWVQQQVFMSLDDDADIDCQNMKIAFSQWQDHVVGGLGPFGAVQMSGRTMEYKISQDKFFYHYGTKSYISMSLPNIGIAPRHFYDLYYANLPEFQTMRNLVTQYSNCDDIGLNFMIGYVYPQLRPVAFTGINARMKSFAIEINKTPSHGQKRNDCLNQFSQILGENTFSYSVINRNQQYEKNKQDPLRKYQCLLALKRSIVQQKYLNYDHYYTFMKALYVYNSTQLSNQLVDKINADKYILGLEDQVKESLRKADKIDLKYKPRHSVESVFGVQVVGEKINQSYNNNNKSQHNDNEFKMAQEQNKILVNNLASLQQQFQVLKSVLIVTNVLLVIIVAGIMLRFCINCWLGRKQRKAGERLHESYTTQMQSSGVSERLADVK